jgi:hypothetical protein
MDEPRGSGGRQLLLIAGAMLLVIIALAILAQWATGRG